MNIAEHPLLGRRPARQAPQVTFLPPNETLSMISGRLHEACGPARRTLALWIAAHIRGPILWITPGWSQEHVHADGMAEWTDPGRFLFVDALRADDVLWAMEESLRSGAAPLVIGDLPGPPSLTAVRRMHLAAETGSAALGRAPLGVVLTPDQGGAQGVESRWHLAPDHGHAPLGQWRLSRLRARTAPQASWRVFRASSAQPTGLEIKAA